MCYECPCICVVEAECTTVTSSNKSAEDARRNRTTSRGSASPLSLMLDESGSNDDEEDLPVAKRYFHLLTMLACIIDFHM